MAVGVSDLSALLVSRVVRHGPGVPGFLTQAVDRSGQAPEIGATLSGWSTLGLSDEAGFGSKGVGVLAVGRVRQRC